MEWVADMKESGMETQRQYHRLQESVHALIQRAGRAKMGADRQLVERIQTEGSNFLQVPAPLAIGPGGPSHHHTDHRNGPSTPVGSTNNNMHSSPVSFSPLKVNATDDCQQGSTMNSWTSHLFDQLLGKPNSSGLKAIQDEAEVGHANSPEKLDSEAWKRDVLDLLFMAPGAMPSQLQSQNARANPATRTAS